MKIKICGMREPDNIRQVTDLHPDYMGVIFWSGSPRNACQLDPAVLATVPQTIRRVGVFVNETESRSSVPHRDTGSIWSNCTDTSRPKPAGGSTGSFR